ncbi:MAG TPA: 6-carboxytetrahydropterin synthase, partial [Akkermansia muciniphila]|nr:6-carboxytetrahydropterin synthase [Akkermansia muciniphila]
MVYRICKSIELESGHLLSKHPGNCKFPHGHTRSVEMVFRAETLDANDMVLDFKAIKQMMGDFLQQFDHGMGQIGIVFDQKHGARHLLIAAPG